MRTRAARLAALAALLLFIALASTATAATANVEIAGFAFDPPTLTINAGDTVTWTNRDSAQHSAVFASGGPRTRALSNGQSDSIIFATAGTFPYMCGIHGASMTGTVIVRAAATAPPTVAPTAVPTPRPTVAPTVEPTPTASTAPTPSPAPTTAAPSATASPTVAVAVPTQQAPAPASSSEGSGPNAVLIGGALIALIAVGVVAIARIRR